MPLYPAPLHTACTAMSVIRCSSSLCASLTSRFAAIQNVYAAARVCLPGLQDWCCHDFVEDEVFQRGDKLVRRCGESKPAVQWAFWHQLLDDERLLLSPVLAATALVRDASLMNILKMSSMGSTSFARSLSLMLLMSAAYAELLSGALFGSYLRTI